MMLMLFRMKFNIHGILNLLPSTMRYKLFMSLSLASKNHSQVKFSDRL